ncbi:hypothetical protein C2845_PM05G04070 [Panicum miliaceum]|uniref:F-box domain-containing protein n=1 Tax=Panicum miliaceum TaxID=4540 RepID=A0A3L6SWG7_PANMI|nr:hypothetical protein C2845_PM05G04070 [Panicum miliaceum]
MDDGGGDRSPSPQSPAAYLPDELVLEILAQLPAKSLCRFKSVSRSWRGLISDPANRCRFAQTLSGFFFHPAALEGPPWRFCGLSSPGAADGLSTVDSALSFLPSGRGEMVLLDSCNGLLLLSCCSPTTPPSSPSAPAPALCFYVVCNPATADWVALPPPSHVRAWHKHSTCYAALGFDPAVSPHFHVFQLVEHECYDFVEAVDIYSSGTGRWVLHQSRWSGSFSIFFARRTATYLDGALHLATIDNAFAVASVDVRGQAWKVTPAPRGVDDDGRGEIAQSQGRLLFVHHDYPSDAFAIYVRGDHGGEEWVFKQRLSMVDLLGPTTRRGVGKTEWLRFTRTGIRFSSMTGRGKDWCPTT